MSAPGQGFRPGDFSPDSPPALSTRSKKNAAGTIHGAENIPATPDTAEPAMITRSKKRKSEHTGDREPGKTRRTAARTSAVRKESKVSASKSRGASTPKPKATKPAHAQVAKSRASPKTPSNPGGLPTPVSAPSIHDSAASTKMRKTRFHASYDESTENESTGIDSEEEYEAPPTLNVVLKVPASWFTRTGKLKAARPMPPRISNTTQNVPRSATPGTLANRNQARASAGIPTPPAEEDDELNLEARELELRELELRELELRDLEAQIDPKQLRLSRKLTERTPIASKPPPRGLPEVWADSRQALCETVPYFKMPQSGCHQNDGHVYAFLYDGANRCREYMDTDLIIGGAGGGMEADNTGQLVQKKNHTMEEAQVKAVLNDIEYQNPLVVICGNKSEGALCKMPYRYNVLGWFKPVAVWAEKTMGKKNKTWTTIKYRFERLNQFKVAWHSPTTDYTLTADERQSIPPLVKQACPVCSNAHYPIYLIGWMCLTPDCEQFWKLSNGKDAPYGKLDYNPAFLLARTEWANETEPFSVKPPVLRVGNTVGDNLTQINTRGMCCPNCGRCNSRRLFKGWKCENPACFYENFPTHIPVQIPLLHLPWESIGDGPALARNKHDRAQGVQISVVFKHGFKVYRYTFPGVNGALVHLVANAMLNKLPGGADDMFDAMQRHDLHLERRRFGIEKMSGSQAENKSKVAAAQVAAAQVAADVASGAAGSEKGFEQIPSTTDLNQERVQSDVESQPDALVPPVIESTQDASEERAPTDSVSSMNGLGLPQSIESSRESNNGMSKSVSDADTQQRQEPKPTEDDTSVLAPGPATTSVPVAEAKKQNTEDGDFMTAFSMNYGMPYKFVASGASLPFKDSPWPVRAARADLNWASQNFLDPNGHQDLNEELIFAYMEGQKLEYHDDGEEGLGPRIATLSLGGKAKMHLRMKMKHFVGASKTGLLTRERPIPGSIAGTVDGAEITSKETYERRLAAWDQLQKLTDKKAYNKRAKEVPLELGLYEKRMKKADDLVTITLNHGDIVLMEGYDIQTYLEHKVVPEQCLRFALTCRTILPDHLKPEERPSYSPEPDEEEMSALRQMVNHNHG